MSEGNKGKGKMMTRTLLAALATAAMALAMLTSAQAAVETNISEPYSMYVYIPCGNGGTGDYVYLEGNLHVLLSYTLNGNSYSGTSHYQPQGVTGSSLTTGAKYQATGITTDHFKGSLQNGQYAYTYVNNFRIIGQGAAGNYLVHDTYHVTFNANGTMAVSHDNFGVECK